MMPQLALSLLGPPCLLRDGVPFRQRSRKCLALLAYLAVTGGPHTRTRLAVLLWPESDVRRAQSSFRHTLWLLRQQLGDAWLEIDSETIGLDGSHRECVDVVRFRDLLAECQAHDHPTGQPCPQCLAQLEEAVDLYKGDFMAGFTLRDSSEFDDWQSRESETLRRELAKALEELAEGHTAQGEAEKGIAYAQRWLDLDPLHEPAHRCLMRLCVAGGRRSDALRQYEACSQVLQSELGVAPDPETTALYEAIRAGGGVRLYASSPAAAQTLPAVSSLAPAPHYNLPTHPTPFVGREPELAQLAQLLAEPACRLLNVVGPGGIGKTRLAIQAAQEQAHRFAQGVCFVPLAPLNSVEFLPSSIMEALGVSRYGGSEPSPQLLNYLQEKNLLLILDNFEHLLEGTALISEMLRHAPGVKLLVTSRERLSLRDEWLLPLRGMRYPPDEEIERARGEESAAVWPGVASEESISRLEGYSALELFVECARRVRLDFSLATAGASSVARICQLVEGMPLAIELAASWTRAMPCRDIAEEIGRDVSFLSSSLRDIPSRHRSMRAVFDHSWRLLSGEERGVLGRLSVFRGGFHREAAEAVAGASLGLLSALVDKSWLRMLPSGRYEMHELVRQYGAERLEAGEETERMRACHSSYYAAFLQEREPRLYGWGQKEAFDQILADMDNVWAAWNWAAERGHVEALGQCVRSLEEVAELRGWHYEVHQAFDSVSAQLREQLEAPVRNQGRGSPEEADEKTRIVLAEMLRSQATECYKLGLRDQAKTLCVDSLAHLRQSGHGLRQTRIVAQAKGLLGWVLWTQGDHARDNQLLWEAVALGEEVNDPRVRASALMLLAARPHHLGQYREAEDLLQQALAIADDAGDLRYEAWCRDNLSTVLCTEGEYQRASALAEEAYQIRQKLGDRAAMASSLNRMGAIAAALGDYELAKQHYQGGLAIASEVGDPEHRRHALTGLGLVAHALGDYAEARYRFEESLALAKQMGTVPFNALIGLGYTTCVLGEPEQSRQLFCQALELAMRAGRILEALDALVGLATLRAEEGEPEGAVELLSLASHHPATTQATRDRARELLSSLECKLPAELFTDMILRGQGRDLEELVAEVLDESRPVPL